MTKQQAANLSLSYNAVQLVLKIFAAVFTGSVSLLSEAVHSGSDILGSMISFLGVRAGSMPPDEDHPYGHGKLESLAAFGESLLLLSMVAYVVYHSVTHLQHPDQVEYLEVGLAIICFTTIAGSFVAIAVKKAADETNSPALASNSNHLRSDVLASAGVIAALLVVKLTGWKQADAAFAIGFSLWLAFGAIKIMLESIQQLIDRHIPAERMQKLRMLLDSNTKIMGYHRLRTRLSGDTSYVDLHIVLPNHLGLMEAHDIADDLEDEIEKLLHPAQCVIHVDPYEAAKAYPAKLPDS